MEKLSNLKLKMCLLVAFSIIIFASCKDDKDKLPTYDPNSPITLTDYYPTVGGIATKMILTGENFGSDPKNIKVYFNDKRAAVISSIGNKIYVICPRKPGIGDENQLIDCKLSVVIGKDSVVYDKTFTYMIRTVVTTVCGIKGAPDEVVTGNLAQTTMPLVSYLAIDNNNNIFVCCRNKNSYYNDNKVLLVNEDEDISRVLIPNTGSPLNQPCLSDDGRSVYIPSDGGTDYWTMSSDNLWSPMKMTMRPNTGENLNIQYKHSFAFCKTDGYMYTRAKNGTLYRFDQKTGITNQVASQLMDGSDSYIGFSRKDPSKLFLAYTNNHCIYTFDLKTQKHELFAGYAGKGGYIDGKGGEAMFNEPRQLIFTDEDDMYVADTKNHVIRKITPDGMVSTVIGQAGESGYLDGTPEDALFDSPYGVAINRDGIIYIGDFNNQCVRRLAIE